MRIFDDPHSHYALQGILGQGGTSVVYLARHRILQTLRAIKEIAKTPVNQGSYSIELAVLGKVRRQGIPQIYDVLEDADHWYIVEEYIEGTTFREYIESEDRTLEELLKVIGEVCDLLTCLHTLEPAGVVYNDLKPENLVVSEKGLYLLDFGNCRWLEKKDRKTGLLSNGDDVGEAEQHDWISAYSVSPEHFSGEVPSVMTDVYGIGVLIQEIYRCRRDLFTGSPMQDGGMATVMNEVITGCMEKDREDRFSTPDKVKRYLLENYRHCMCGSHQSGRHADSRHCIAGSSRRRSGLSYVSNNSCLDNQPEYVGENNRLNGVGEEACLEIFVYNSRSGGGATHFAAGYAGYLHSLGENAVYVEHTGTNSMLQFLDKNKSGVRQQNGMYIYHECVMRPDYEGFVEDDSEKIRGTKRINIHDCGRYSANVRGARKKDVSCCRNIVVVADVKSYTRISCEDYEMDDKSKDPVLYIVNFSDIQGYRHFKRNIAANALRMPFFDNPFVMGREVCDFYAKVTKALGK